MSNETQFQPSGDSASGKLQLLSEFSTHWSRGDIPHAWDIIGQVVLPPADLVEILKNDLVQHWRRHSPLLVERYFEHWPSLLNDENSAVALIRAEFDLRTDLGQAPQPVDYEKRFPQWTNQLRAVLVPELLQATLMPGDSSSQSNSSTQSDVTLMPGTVPRGDETILNVPASSPTHPNTILATGVSPKPPPAASVEFDFPKIPGFEFVQELGRGGMGVVYKARQVRAGRDVALKVIRPDMLSLMPSDSQSSTVGRFRHEARAAGRLLHDNIVTVYEVGEWGTYHYFAMRMVDGPSLVQLLRERPLENRQAAQFLAGTARGVQFAHEQGILHRDLKPHNILIDSRSQRPLVADFGLAKFTADTNELTRAGDVIGTPSYMSPEQAQDSSKVTALSDVYSLGATLYHVLAGRPPFQAANLGETIRQILHEEPLPPRQLNPAIDADLETICLKCLQKEPAKRYASAGALADDLDRYLRNEPILARPVSTPEKVFRWCKRNPALAGSIAAVVLLAMLAVTSIVVGYRETAAALVIEAAAKEKAQGSLLEALESINETTIQVSEESLLGQPGLQPLRRSLLLTAQKHYQKFLDRKWDDPQIRFEIANAAFRVGEIQQSFGEFEKAESLFIIAEERQRELLTESPNDSKVLLALSNTINAQAQRFMSVEDYGKALGKFGEGLAIREKLTREYSEDKEFLRKQANIHMNCGIAHMKNQNGELALQELEKGQTLRLELNKKFVDDEKIQYDLAKGAFGLAQFYFARASDSSSPEEYAADAQRAKQELTKSIAYFEGLLATQPKHVVYRSKLVICFQQLLGMNLEDPAPVFERALKEVALLVAENPTVENYRVDHAETLLRFAGYLVNQNEPSRALETHAEIEQILQPLISKNITACELAADNHKYWAQTLGATTESGKSHLQQALTLWQAYKKLAGNEQYANSMMQEITDLLAADANGKTSASTPTKQ
jgi:eukaryotic-like serine/threonine-protein kinase